VALSQEHLQDLVVVLGVPVALSYLWLATLLPPKLRAYLSHRRVVSRFEHSAKSEGAEEPGIRKEGRFRLIPLKKSALLAA
jgi:hypothetical protein